MRYLITSALPYINGIKHLGNLVGSMLPADVYARFLRKSGHEVLFICGTDEHGTPAEIAAEQAGQDIKTYCDHMYEIQKEIYQGFKLSFDYFGRSSSQSNHQLTQEIFLSLQKNGFIQEKTIEQFYSLDDKRFLPDRYVMGTCPKCHYEKARGDQCDGCGALLDPLELITPYSSLSGSRNLELRSSTHLFLKLQDLEKDLKLWIDSHDEWPPMTKGIAQKWLSEGLKERCITRDLKWGIPVPGYENKVFYVWFDAPNAYISITKDFDLLNWKRWWLDPGDVYYVQFMAKDNVPFHAVFWPAVLMGTKENWKLVDYLKSMSWLNFEGGKFSTSQSRGIFLDEALRLYPSDYWRYYLMSHIPETDDVDFTLSHFSSVINKDLADTLGNFVNRCLVMVEKNFNGNVKPYALEDEWLEKFKGLFDDYSSALYKMKFRHALGVLREIWTLGNAYIALKEPWKLELNEAEKVLSKCLLMMKFFASISENVIPDTAAKIYGALGIQGDYKLDHDLLLPPENNWAVKKIPPLFAKILDD